MEDQNLNALPPVEAVLPAQDPYTNIEQAKQALYAQEPPPPSILEAKQAMFNESVGYDEQGNPNVIPGIAEAKRALFSKSLGYDESGAPNVIPGIVEAKQSLLLNNVEAKRAAIGKTGNVGPSLYGKQYAHLSEANKKKAVEIDNQKQIAVAQAKEKLLGPQPILSDKQADTALGGAVNTTLSLIGGAAKVVSDIFLTSVPTLGNYINNIGIEPEEYDVHTEITAKRNVGQELTEDEQLYLSSNQDNFDAITDIKAKREFIDAINTGVKSVQAWTNTTKQQKALKELGVEAQDVAEDFANGDYFSGLGKYLIAAKNLAFNNPAAAIELLANTLPQMAVLAKKSAVGLFGLTTAQHNEAIDAFIEEYGREPDTTERTLALGLSGLSAGADLIGAKLTLGGASYLKGIKDLSKQLSINVPTKLVKKADGAILGAAKKTVGAVASVTAKPVTGFVGEGATEGAQNFLNQLAGKQDLDKVDYKEIVSDSVVGSVIGGGIASVAPAAKVTGATVDTGLKAVGKTVDAAIDVKNSFNNVDTAIAKAKEKNKPEIGLKAISSLNFTELTEEEQVAKIKDFSELSIIFGKSLKEDSTEKQQAEHAKKADEYKSTLENLLSAHTTQYKDGSVAKAHTNLNKSRPKEQIEDIKQDIKTVTDSVVAGTASPELVEQTLGSRDFEDNATPAQIKVLKSFHKFSSAVNNPESGAQVADEVLNGGNGNLGVLQHTEDINLAVSTNNKINAAVTVKRLQKFLAARIKTRDLNDDGTKRVWNGKGGRATLDSINVGINAIVQTLEYATDKYNYAFDANIKADIPATAKVNVNEIQEKSYEAEAEVLQQEIAGINEDFSEVTTKQKQAKVRKAKVKAEIIRRKQAALAKKVAAEKVEEDSLTKIEEKKKSVPNPKVVPKVEAAPAAVVEDTVDIYDTLDTLGIEVFQDTYLDGELVGDPELFPAGTVLRGIDADLDVIHNIWNRCT